MKKIFSIVLLFISLTEVQAQPAGKDAISRPKLIVGIVIDQMRYDLLYRYWDLYGNGGFKRLVNEGYSCSNARFNYLLTVTAAGHATIYSGTNPSIHGVVDNNYYDRQMHSTVYVMADSSVRTVGNAAAAAGMSPFRLMSTTVTDELKLASKNSKVIGIAMKDRSAMMPAGHFADGAYYFDGSTGNWISSTWYTKQLPTWLDQFNRTRKVDDYLSSDWTLLLPRNKYTMCTGDTNKYEHPLPGEALAVFPHKLTKGKYGNLAFTPFGLSMTREVAQEAITNENLGKRGVTDFLCISFSSTDLVQHFFGPNSLETADCYVRLDRELESLLKFLDENIGKENVLVFVTADHGGAINPEFGKDHQISGGVMLADSLVRSANKYLASYFGEGKWILAMSSQQVYLNTELITSSKLNEKDVAERMVDFLMQQPGIMCVTAPKYNINTCAPFVQSTIMNGYYPERSGDIIYSMKAGWIDWIFDEGTSHGSVFDYDEHVPLLWYGWKIPHGESAEKISITDIAPTISNWLRISNPSGCTGNPITSIVLK